MSLNLVSQYKFSSTGIVINVSSAIDADFIENFVNEYKNLLKEKLKKGAAFTEDSRILKFNILNNEHTEDEDFDLLFISYLVLIKEDFPNIAILIDFVNFIENQTSNAYIFKLAQHRIHLIISCRQDIFKIYKKGVEFLYEKIAQSTSYIPPIFISQDTVGELFEKKINYPSLKSDLENLIIENKKEFSELEHNKDAVLYTVQDLYISKIGRIENWSTKNLSVLYLFKALSELFILRFLVDSALNKKNDYQIGRTIISSQQDRQSPRLFREGVMYALENNGVFQFNEIECFIFSLTVQNTDLFKIPTSLPIMFSQIEPLLSESEKKKSKNFAVNKSSEKYLKSQYIDLYIYNLKRIINYVKDTSYGLQELAKNIVEHSSTQKGQGYGMLTARCYSFEKISLLKNTLPGWLANYQQKHKFMDINLIDSGLASVMDSYAKTLEKEIASISSTFSDFKEQIINEYEKDLNQLGNFMLNNLFNFDSITLFHQINRTKARLGLLIFSQTILYEKNAFVSLASNSINSDDTVGFYLYKKGAKISNEPNYNFLAVGTNYSFIIPLKEEFEREISFSAVENDKSGSSSSVYKELHPYIEHNTLKNLVIERKYNSLDKYSKIDSLTSECLSLVSINDILVVNAEDVAEILQNSSDWVRFLASLQFSAEYIKDVIIFNFDIDLYIELINILKIFDNNGDSSGGFWKDDRYVLFFLPLRNENRDVFWFNSLLCSTEYSFFRKINDEIGLYHENLSKMAIDQVIESPMDHKIINSKLYSSSDKLLNFELLIKNTNGETLFEETLKSLVNIEINDSVNEN